MTLREPISFAVRQPGRSFLLNLVILLSIIATGVTIGAVIAGPIWFQEAMLATVMGLTAILSLEAARSARDPRVQTSWRWLAAGMLFFGLYHGARILGQHATGTTLMFVAYALCLAGLAYAVLIPRDMLARLVLDIGIVVAGVTVIIGKLLQTASVSLADVELSNVLIYVPLIDLAMLSLIGVALASTARASRLYLPLVRIALALGFLFAGHLWKATTIVRGYDAPDGYRLFLLSAGFVVGLAAVAFTRAPDGAGERPATIAAHNPLVHSFFFHVGNAVLPYTVAMSAATLLFMESIGAEQSLFDDRLLIAGSLVFVGLGGLRHVLSHLEARSLYTSMRNLNRHLEAKVDQRTAELVRRNRELEAVHKVATLSATSLDLDTILAAVAEQLTQISGASECIIHERTAEGVTVAAYYERGVGSGGMRRSDIPGFSLVALPKSRFDQVGQRSAMVRRWEEHDSSDAALVLDHHSATVALLVPIVAHDQTVGVAEIYRTGAREFTAEEVSIAEAVATQAALATENARAFGTAKFAARHDPVTGLLNHRALHEELRRMFEEAVAGQHHLTVMMMDLNLFKEFNDRYGHQAGDAVLKDIATSIRASVPSSAVTARYGGDEFTVVIPFVPPQNVQMFAGAVRERIASIQDQHGFVGDAFGIAIGVAVYPEDGDSLDTLISRADDRMYTDKRRLKGTQDRRRNVRPAPHPPDLDPPSIDPRV